MKILKQIVIVSTFIFMSKGLLFAQSAGINYQALILNSEVIQIPGANVEQNQIALGLDQLYDRAKSWKVDTANLEYPNITTQPITGDNSLLDLGAINLVVDPMAGSALNLNKTTNILTIKSTALGVGTRFSGLTTTGSVSTANGGALQFGYSHSSGTRVKYLEIRGLANAAVSVTVTDNIPATPVNLVPTAQVPSNDAVFKASFNAPMDEMGTQILVARDGFFSSAQLFPAGDLTFITTPVFIPFAGLQQNQETMIRNSLKLLQKTEAIRNVYTTPPTTPTLNITTTMNTGTGDATVGNQDKIIDILNRVLSKVTAIREVLKN